jgi:hypothetical protein
MEQWISLLPVLFCETDWNGQADFRILVNSLIRMLEFYVLDSPLETYLVKSEFLSGFFC